MLHRSVSYVYKERFTGTEGDQRAGLEQAEITREGEDSILIVYLVVLPADTLTGSHLEAIFYIYCAQISLLRGLTV